MLKANEWEDCVDDCVDELERRSPDLWRDLDHVAQLGCVARSPRATPTPVKIPQAYEDTYTYALEPQQREHLRRRHTPSVLQCMAYAFLRTSVCAQGVFVVFLSTSSPNLLDLLGRLGEHLPTLPRHLYPLKGCS